MPIKIGILSEFHLNTVNYGNQLQAFALGCYIKSIHEEYVIEYIVPDAKKKKRTSYTGVFIRKVWSMIKRTDIHAEEDRQNRRLFEKRYGAFAEFRENWLVSSPITLDWKGLQEIDCDLLIVGSDVVWVQERFNVNKVMFLDFKGEKDFHKIAYAASFGKDWVPRENRRYVRKCLRDFQMISVREKSSIQLLDSLGIKKAVHTLDPTLLLGSRDWEKIEKKPSFEVVKERDFSIFDVPFAFVYLLGATKEQKIQIGRICRQNRLALVSIPCADDLDNKENDAFGGCQVPDCSPQEWVWLVHHASCVITNSFHGVVFSTIFKRRFLAVVRGGTIDINNRLYDYLDTIGQSDKMADPGSIGDLNALQWDYKEIQERLDVKIKNSKEFLEDAFNTLPFN